MRFDFSNKKLSQRILSMKKYMLGKINIIQTLYVYVIDHGKGKKNMFWGIVFNVNKNKIAKM